MKSAAYLARSLATLSLVIALMNGGCATGASPSPARREAAIEHGLLQLGDKWPDIAASVFLTVSSDEPFTPQIQTVAGQVDRIEFVGVPEASRQGMATAIAANGYLLTDMHVLLKHVWILGIIDGQAQFRPARIVQQHATAEYGAEVAVIHVDGINPPTLDLHPAPITLQSVISVASRLAEGDLDIAPLAGRLTVPPLAQTDQILRHDLPIRPGDSGGPLLTADGQLIAVNNSWIKRWALAPVIGLSYAPDPAMIRAWIEADRGSATASTPAVP